ncbi:hypothetical protein HII31_08672 [Pseudocercospora fuligena]|uniref:Uncharacterized protein n=1 Tax=Pseudocercospora fuligena TaxID=685502 RepID=A0A8H6RHX1_9PEZI|nr:hypothetical protein HII31_08672 [Pseudocercospora fuligena]
MQSFRQLASRQSTRVVRAQQTRPLSFTRTLRLKEDKPQDGHELEKAKQQQHHSEEKRDELRSSSESAVKADQNKQDVESLQKETAKQSQKEHPHGKS